MARTPLAGVSSGSPSQPSAGEERRTTRARFVKEAGAAALGLAALGRLAAPARGAATPRIVVVGAGLAGLSAAYELKKAGYAAEVHEASERVGGRCWTLRGAFAEGQIAERGGELIDQGHTQIRHLAQELGLELDNLSRAEENGTELLGFFDGAPYHYTEMTDDIKDAWQKIHRDVSAASYPTTFESSTERGRELDDMSIVDWIEETFEGGIELADRAAARRRLHDRVRRRLVRAELAQPGLPARLPRPGPVPRLRRLRREVPRRRRQRPDHRRARGGDRPGRSRTGSELVAVRRNATGTFTLTFRQASGMKTVTADKVVLALPFSILRSSVDLSRAGFDAAQAHRDPRAGHGLELEAPPPVLEPLLERGNARTARRSPTPATRTRGR